MNINIDSAIFIGFLIVNLVIGLWTSRGISNIREYAIGDRNFSTATIAATIVATWVSGEFFYTNLTEAYKQGLNFIWVATLGNLCCLLSIGLFFSPRMGEFLGNLSIAEAMGDLFGKKVRIITAVSGFIGAAGMISIQLKMAGLMFEYALGIPTEYGTIVAAIIITLYSSLGGIKSVTLTDVIQFLTFGIIIPVIAYILLNSINNIDTISDTLTNSPLFDYKQVFDFTNPTSLQYLFLFLFFAVPDFPPAIFQRIAMARDTKQVGQSFIVASITCVLFIAIINWIGILALSINPGLDSNDIVKTVIFNSSYVGLKGLMLAGIMAMIMSTVDSYINATAVLIVHDFCKPLRLKFIENELFSARTVSAMIGVFALILSLRESSLLDLIIVTYSLYLPVVTIPFIMAIIGFRSSEKSVILGMIAGFTTVMLWDYVLHVTIGNSIPPAMLANLMTLIGSHYLLKQKGGWVGIKVKEPLEAIRQERKIRIRKVFSELRSFNLVNICKKNTPHGEGLISMLGVFVMVTTFSSTHTLGKVYHDYYAYLLDILYPITLCSSSVLITYPLWLPKWKEMNFICLCWNLIMFSVLISFSFLMVLISNFSEIQLMAFMINIILLSSMMTWRWSLFTITLGVTLTTFCYYTYIHIDIDDGFSPVSFKIIYLLLLLMATLVTFLKPKQEYIEATEHKVETLGDENKKLTHKAGVLRSENKKLICEAEMLENEKAKLMHKSETLRNENKKLAHEAETLEKENVKLGNKVTDLNDKVTNLNEQVFHYNERISDQEKEIERLGATAQKILNNVNHELRLPIGNVMNFSDMMNETLHKSGNTELLKELAKEVYDNSNRVSTMILNMLDLATLDVKKVDLQKTTINFSELVTDRVKTCRKIYLRDKKIDFELTLEPEIMIAVDPNYIRQTVDNLVINAINFSEKGLIKVSVSKQKGQVIFTILDQGKGIPPTQLSDIFTPFKMGSNTESKAQGRGVGLALCKSAVEAHGGSIAAESNGVCGASVRFSLPISE